MRQHFPAQSRNPTITLKYQVSTIKQQMYEILFVQRN